MNLTLSGSAGYGAALLVGLLGGVHCVGMCGGIVGALGLGMSPARQSRIVTALPVLLAYNLGRIASYTLAGALAGGVGWYAAQLVSVHRAQLVLGVAAGLFMVALGLYLAGLWRGLAEVERLGGHVWRRIEPLGRRLLPVRGPLQALGLGAVWGWLPCGLVYSVLIWALASGGPLRGALLMLCFGLGTLPNLLAMGVFAARLARLARRVWVRVLAGGLVAGFGVLSLLRWLPLPPHA
ncbi:sulfite exporter TauE/SafE family protein [Acidihalobacter prosperus]|uniref:Membrane protein n=1 Tax=Acidihalobacter prosperus TaxID=160660 RepID=A0A1A6C0R0_9GAMM|nr:sulfite exporter TauE/SafE family protein [Acidihalobacter prosperus]OBS08152.1 membrane protein [Acidihalobacter prosperus]